MANNFLALQRNLKVGKSLIEENSDKIIEKIYNVEAQKNNCNIIIPEDCNVSD